MSSRTGGPSQAPQESSSEGWLNFSLGPSSSGPPDPLSSPPEAPSAPSAPVKHLNTSHGPAHTLAVGGIVGDWASLCQSHT